MDKIVIPRFRLGEMEDRWKENYKSFSAAEYISDMPLPTLAELRHAFFGGFFDYWQSVHSYRGFGEWTSTFLRDGKEVVERPGNLICRNGVWVLEGGKVTPVELPPDGWTLEYDIATGFPSRTSKDREDAEKIFGDDASRFWNNEDGVRPVARIFFHGEGGPFCVDAGCVPDRRYGNIKGRVCRRD